MTEESLFAAALEKSSVAERRAFLDAACGHDSCLRDRVERLLAADERSRGILEQIPVVALMAADPHDTQSLDRPPHSTPFPGQLQTIPELNPPGYELTEHVGEGGMGMVYRARDTRLARDVAIKVLRARFAVQDPAARRFLDEARITAQLQHPGVPPVHVVGALPDGRPFLAMKLIQGRTLDVLLKERTDPAHDRGGYLAIFEQVCQAVAYAHSHQVIHRDLKPLNVMVGAFGEVQVMDWGLAKVLEPEVRPVEARAGGETTASASAIDSDRGERDATRTGSVLGTPAYMPPEQAIGAIDQIDRRSDVFGLGAILCAILTGQPPYVGSDSESTRQLAARARLDDAFARLNGCGADPDFVELCQRCLAAEKSDRPADAGEVARSVASLRAAADERARAAELDRVQAEGELRSAAVRAAEQKKRRRVQRVLAVAAGLLLAGGGAFAWYLDRQATKQQIEDEGRRRQSGAEIAALLDQCQAALKADRSDQAAMALDAAERRASDGGAAEWADRLAACRADLTLLRELDAIDTFSWTWNGGFPEPEALASRWQAALAAYGVTPDEGRAAEMASRVNRSLVRDRLLTALDGWLGTYRPAGLRAGVRAVLRSADPQPYRDAVRDAVATGDGQRLTALIRQPEALDQPARFVVTIGRIDDIPADLRRAMLESALRTRHGDLGLLMAMGQTYPFSQQEGADERVRWYQAALAAHPGNLSALHDLGIALGDQKKLDGAIAVVREVIRRNSHHAPAHYNLGQLLAEKGDSAGALAANREAVRLNIRFAPAHYNLGNALRDQGDVAGAITSFQNAIRLNPKYASAHVNLGAILCDVKRDFDGAIAHLREALRLEPDLAPAHYNLGNALYRKEELDGAITHFKEAARLAPEHAPAHFGLGQALKAKGDLDGAIDSFNEAIRADPNDAEPRVILGAILCDVKRDYDGAIAHFQEAIRLDPKHTTAHFNLGNAFWGKGDVDGAITSYKAAIRVNPKYANAHYMLGIVLWEKMDLDGAIASFRETVQLNPKQADAHNRLAWILAAGPDRLRDRKQAVEHATRSCELTGWKNPITLSTLAAAHAEAGDFDKAVEYQKKALTVRKGDATADRERLQLYAQKKPFRDPSLVPRERVPLPRVVKR